MSVYFIIAIALSAMSAVTEVQVARPRLAHVQMVRAERRVIRVARKMVRERVGQTFLSGRPDKNVWPTFFTYSPRAPATARS